MDDLILFKEIIDKKAYLKEHYPFYGVPQLTDKKVCIHCGQTFTVDDFKVQIQYNDFTENYEEYIVCPNAPQCDGTVIDWFPEEASDLFSDY